uniref:Uncharacterized protein n=1 Tax=Cyprinus carpio TaxID=7962 RepID=A0A8C2HWB3_CYPCA
FVFINIPLPFHPGGRLDMSHGFLKHIRRNQIARSPSPLTLTRLQFHRWTTS